MRVEFGGRLLASGGSGADGLNLIFLSRPPEVDVNCAARMVFGSWIDDCCAMIGSVADGVARVR